MSDTRIQDMSSACKNILEMERKLTDEKVDAIYREIRASAAVLEHRLQNMNEFRSQIEKERLDYVRRDWFDAQLRFVWTISTTLAAILSFVINIIMHFWAK